MHKWWRRILTGGLLGALAAWALMWRRRQVEERQWPSRVRKMGRRTARAIVRAGRAPRFRQMVAASGRALKKGGRILATARRIWREK